MFEPQHGEHYWDTAARHYNVGIHEIQLAARSPHAIDRMVLHHSSMPFNEQVFVSAPESRGAGAPVVNAGSDQSVDFSMTTNNVSIVLTGSVSAAEAFTSVWSKLSGPGTVTFADTHALTTTVTIAGDPGDYVLQLAANSDSENASNTVTIIEPTDAAVIPVGNTVTVSATIKDDREVSVGELYVDGVLQHMIASTPYTWTVDRLATGTHSLKVCSVDSSGNSATKSITILVSPTIPALTKIEGGALQLSWSPTNLVLECTSNLNTAVWLPAAGATSPYSLTTTNKQMYYRMQLP